MFFRSAVSDAVHLLPGLAITSSPSSAGNGLLGSLAGSSVRPGPLTVEGQPTPVADPFVATISTLRLMLAATSRRQVTFDLDVAVDEEPELVTSSSVRSRTRVSRERPVCSQTNCAVGRPIPKM